MNCYGGVSFWAKASQSDCRSLRGVALSHDEQHVVLAHTVERKMRVYANDDSDSVGYLREINTSPYDVYKLKTDTHRRIYATCRLSTEIVCFSWQGELLLKLSATPPASLLEFIPMDLNIRADGSLVVIGAISGGEKSLVCWTPM